MPKPIDEIIQDKFEFLIGKFDDLYPNRELPKFAWLSMKTNVVAKHLLACLLLFLASYSVNAQIYISELPGESVGSSQTTMAEYTLTGDVVSSPLFNPQLITINDTIALATSGNQLVLGTQSPYVSVMNLSGGTATFGYSRSATQSSGVAIIGNNLFVSSDSNGIDQYNLTTGQFVNSATYGPPGFGYFSRFAVLRSDMLIASLVANKPDGVIQVFDPATQTVVNPSLVTGLTNSQLSLAVSDTNLFVLNADTIAKYTLTGGVVNSNFIPSLSGTVGLAISGNDLFVLSSSYVNEYDATTGDLLQPNLISGLTNATAITIATAVPEPSSWTLLVGGLALIFWYLLTRQRHGAQDKL